MAEENVQQIQNMSNFALDLTKLNLPKYDAKKQIIDEWPDMKRKLLKLFQTVLNVSEEQLRPTSQLEGNPIQPNLPRDKENNIYRILNWVFGDTFPNLLDEDNEEMKGSKSWSNFNSNFGKSTVYSLKQRIEPILNMVDKRRQVNDAAQFWDHLMNVNQRVKQLNPTIDDLLLSLNISILARYDFLAQAISEINKEEHPKLTDSLRKLRDAEVDEAMRLKYSSSPHQEEEPNTILGIEQRPKPKRFTCSRCGGRNHTGEKCTKTKGKKCNYCQKMNHFEKMCKTKMRDQYGNNKRRRGNEDHSHLAMPIFNIQTSKITHQIIIDSGATVSITNNIKHLINIKYNRDRKIQPIHGIKGECDVKAKGTMILRLKDTENKTCMLKIDGVLYCPTSSTSLLSTLQLEDQGIHTDLQQKQLIVERQKIPFERKHNLLCLRTGKETEFIGTADQKRDQPTFVELWHKRLGHIGIDRIKSTMKATKNTWKGETLEQSYDCEDCGLANIKKKAVKKNEHEPRATRPKQAAAADVVGPFVPSYPSKYKYMMNFIDLYSKIIYTYPMKDLRNTDEILMRFRQDWKGNDQSRTTLYLDNAKYYVKGKFAMLMRQWSWEQKLCTPYTHQLHPIEPINGKLLAQTRAMLQGAKLDDGYWPAAYQCAAYLSNRTPMSRESMTPYEKHTGIKPNITHVRTFGSKVVFRNPTPKHKMQQRGKTGILLGYGLKHNHGTYLIQSNDTKRLIYSRDVVVYDTENTLQDSDDATQTQEPKFYIPAQTRENYPQDEQQQPDTNPEIQEQPPMEIEEENSNEELPNNQQEDANEAVGATDADAPPPTKRARTAPIRLIPSMDKATTPYSSSQQRLLHSHHLEEKGKLSNNNDEREVAPKNYREWMNLPIGKKERWRIAMDEEHSNLKRTATFQVVDRNTVHTKIMKTMWVYTVKPITNQLKCRLVVVGTSEPIESKTDLYSPTIKQASLILITALARGKGYEAYSFDVKSAFLESPIGEDEYLFVEPPDGLEIGKDKCYRLLKSQYGLRTASSRWMKELASSLKECGLKQSKIDPALFYNEECYILTHVDDGRVLSKMGKGKKYLNMLNKRYKLKITDLSKDTEETYLGSKWYFHQDRTEISNRRFIEDLLSNTRMEQANRRLIPMEVKKELNDHDKDEKNPLYQSIVGSLLYISKYRSDISFGVNQLCRHNHKNGEDHMNAAKWLIRYLKGTKDKRLIIPNITGDSMTISIYSDASFASTKDEKKLSTTGYVMMINNTPITWGSKKQSIVATSSREAELVATFTSVLHTITIRNLLEEIGEKPKRIEVYIDNQAVIDDIKRGCFKTESRHLSTKFLKLNYYLETGQINVNYINTKENPADLFTKALARPEFQKHNDNIMNGNFRTVTSISGGVLKDKSDGVAIRKDT